MWLTETKISGCKQNRLQLRGRLFYVKLSSPRAQSREPWPGVWEHCPAFLLPCRYYSMEKRAACREKLQLVPSCEQDLPPVYFRKHRHTLTLR